MEPKRFQNWLRQIGLTEREEISCSECLDLVSRYVDLEIVGEAAAELLPGLAQHLEQCQVCHEEYLVLHELARLDVESRLPSEAELRQSLKDGPGPVSY